MLCNCLRCGLVQSLAGIHGTVFFPTIKRVNTVAISDWMADATHRYQRVCFVVLTTQILPSPHCLLHFLNVSATPRQRYCRNTLFNICRRNHSSSPSACNLHGRWQRYVNYFPSSRKGASQVNFATSKFCPFAVEAISDLFGLACSIFRMYPVEICLAWPFLLSPFIAAHTFYTHAYPSTYLSVKASHCLRKRCGRYLERRRL